LKSRNREFLAELNFNKNPAHQEFAQNLGVPDIESSVDSLTNGGLSDFSENLLGSLGIRPSDFNPDSINFLETEVQLSNYDNNLSSKPNKPGKTVHFRDFIKQFESDTDLDGNDLDGAFLLSYFYSSFFYSVSIVELIKRNLFH
jgi:hypothetical protein